MLLQNKGGLEEKLRQSTPISAGPRAGTMCSTDPQSVRNFNSSYGTGNQSSSLLKGADSLRELRRKIELRSRGIENNFLLASPIYQKTKTPLTIESTKGRGGLIDTSRALARVTKTAQRPLSSFNSRTNREQQVTGVKDRDNRTRFIWSR